MNYGKFGRSLRMFELLAEARNIFGHVPQHFIELLGAYKSHGHGGKHRAHAHYGFAASDWRRASNQSAAARTQIKERARRLRQMHAAPRVTCDV